LARGTSKNINGLAESLWFAIAPMQRDLPNKILSPWSGDVMERFGHMLSRNVRSLHAKVLRISPNCSWTCRASALRKKTPSTSSAELNHTNQRASF